MSSERSMVGRFFSWLWRFINGTRIVFLNLVFFGFVFLLFGSAFTPDTTVRLSGDTTLVLQPHGNVVEEYSSTAFDRLIIETTEQLPPETRLRDLVTAVERASTDTRIKQMVIDTDYLAGIGLAALLDLQKAIDAFKDTGKPVIALGQSMSQHQYYLAALADEVWLNPNGMVWIDGYSNVRSFYQEGLEKLAVEINLFRVGEYKSAMEPYIRNDMSPEAKEAALHWLGSLWQTYLEGISRHRGLPPQSLSQSLQDMPDRVEALGGDFAAYALSSGLVDRLVGQPEARQELALRGAANSTGDGYRAISVADYLTVTEIPAPLRPRADVLVLVAEGQIVGGRQGPGTISSETVAEQLRAIGRKEEVRALVLRINSPGGDALASEQIRRELQVLRDAGKTVVVSMGDVAASGGYWMAMDADEIWASSSTITGSIGVFGMIPTFGGTLAKVGVYSDGVGTTDLAGKLRIDRPLDPQLKRVFQSSTEHVYEDFISGVARGRGLSVEAVDAVARGRVWSGRQAQEHGLVDRLGGLQDAVAAAARIAGLGSDFSMQYHTPLVTPLEQFFLDMGSGVLARLPLATKRADLTSYGFLQDILEDLRSVAAADGRFTVVAHCMCVVR